MLWLGLLVALAGHSAADTLGLRRMDREPTLEALHPAVLGDPSVVITTGQGQARLWLLRTSEAVYLAASIPDTTYYWGDDLVISLDLEGDGATEPGHDDFQWYFRRLLDSSVVYRGRGGRWAPPRGDPDWRLGTERSGGGWEVSARGTHAGWSLLLRLDPQWLEGRPGRLPAIAFRIFDDDPSGWYAWPLPPPGVQPGSVEDDPSLWVPVRAS